MSGLGQQRGPGGLPGTAQGTGQAEAGPGQEEGSCTHSRPLPNSNTGRKQKQSQSTSGHWPAVTTQARKTQLASRQPGAGDPRAPLDDHPAGTSLQGEWPSPHLCPDLGIHGTQAPEELRDARVLRAPPALGRPGTAAPVPLPSKPPQPPERAGTASSDWLRAEGAGPTERGRALRTQATRG